jgi:hypothetical protein
MATATRLTPILVVLPRPSSGRVSVILAPSSKGLRFFGTSIRRKLGTRAMRTSLSLTPKERRSMESAAPMGTRPEYRLGQLSILRYNPISWRYESENASTRRYRPSDKLKPYRACWPSVKRLMGPAQTISANCRAQSLAARLLKRNSIGIMRSCGASGGETTAAYEACSWAPRNVGPGSYPARRPMPRTWQRAGEFRLRTRRILSRRLQCWRFEGSR